MKRFLTLLYLVLLPLSAGAQFVSLGDDPGRVRWMSVQTRDYRVLYPAGLDSLARTYAIQHQFARDGIYSGLHYLFGELPSYLVGGFFSHPAIRFQELGMTGADKFYVGFTARLGLEQW